AGNLSDSFPSGDEDNTFTGNVNNEINGNWISAPTGSIHEARLKAKNSSRDSGRGDSLSDNGESVRPKGKLLNRKPA
ncbi:hypothetical protein M9458_043510, partial [Cirrhinus mrigala]